MGRPQTIFVDRQKLLRAIGRSVIRDVGAIDAKLNGRTQYGYGARLALERERRTAVWQFQNLAAWAGRELTDSELIRHRQAIVALETAGMLTRDGRHIALTPAGWTAAGLTPPSKTP